MDSLHAAMTLLRASPRQRPLRLLLAFASALACAGASVAARAQAQAQAQGVEHTLEAYVSDDSIQAAYSRDLELDEIGSTTLTGGVFYNEDRDLVAMGTVLGRIGAADGNRRLVVRVGPRVYAGFLSQEDEDVFALGLGGEVRYYLDASRETSVSLEAYHAPDIVTFGEADNMSEASLRLETTLRSGTRVFVGYRSFEVDFVADRELDDNVHVGFQRDF